MIAEELYLLVSEVLGFEPTREQADAIRCFCDFMFSRQSMPVMVMRGSAGTGKTTLAGALVKTMRHLRYRTQLLAPTGRAAKVFSLSAGSAAFTIHRHIYRQKRFTGDMTGFTLNPNKSADTLYIIDESSMISNEGLAGGFGSGRLLDDLVQFVYSGERCRMLLIGDKAQLPPVGEEESPALMPEVLTGYGMTPYVCDLTEVLRQSQESGILYNATVIRQMITHDEVTQLPRIRLKGFADICVVPGMELIEALESSYYNVGIDETMVVTRSNKRANIYNQGIRNRVLDRDEMLSSGDMLMVVRNNYYWTEKENSDIPFIANGDRALIHRVRNEREFYGMTFVDLELRFPDYDEMEMELIAVTDSLLTEAPALTREQQDQLFHGVMEDYMDIPRKDERMKKIKLDPYYNALQIKYAYAVTCHKAQGGQWEHIYIDQGYMTDDMLTPDYIHWLYTAFTRATTRLFLVNWPDEQLEEALGCE